jgi:hypothetical protein
VIQLSKTFVVSIAIACFQSASFAQEIADEKAATAISTKLDQMINRLESIEERLRRIESQFDSLGKRSSIQTVDPPIEFIFVTSPGVAPGQEVVPGQIIGRIEPSPWLKSGTKIEVITIDRMLQREQ